MLRTLSRRDGKKVASGKRRTAVSRAASGLKPEEGLRPDKARGEMRLTAAMLCALSGRGGIVDRVPEAARFASLRACHWLPSACSFGA